MNFTVNNVIPPSVPSSRKGHISFGNRVAVNTALINNLKRDSLNFSKLVKNK